MVCGASCDVRLAGAIRPHAAESKGRKFSGPSFPLRALVTLGISALLFCLEQIDQRYLDLKEKLGQHLLSLWHQVKTGQRYVAHMTINGDDISDCDRIFHTMRQHFRKLQRFGHRVSWCKMISFSESGKFHLHVAIFHDKPLSILLGRRAGMRSKAYFDLPRFQMASDCLRPVWDRGRLTCLRSYNYKIQIVPHNDPAYLLTKYFLGPGNFQPDKVGALGRLWCTASRDLSTRTVQAGFNQISEQFDTLDSVLRDLGMDALIGLAVRTLVLGKTERLERWAAAELVADSASRDSSCSIKENIDNNENTTDHTNKDSRNNLSSVFFPLSLLDISISGTEILAGRIPADDLQSWKLSLGRLDTYQVTARTCKGLNLLTFTARARPP